jgi:serine/threonine protein phosphatase PrpC
MKGTNTMNQRNAFSSENTLHLNVAGHSEVGRLLEHNEDAFALYNVSDPDLAEHLGKLYLLADGTGRHATGETASRFAIETIPAVYYHQSEGVSPLTRLQQAFITADTRIHEFAVFHQEHAEMSTTCTAVVIRGTRSWIAHVGDSRAYLVRTSPQARPTIIRLTTDHSKVATQVRAGDLSPEQMRRSPVDRDILLRALGGYNPYPDFTMHTVRAGDAIVLCSDGLWSTVTEEQVARIVCSMTPQQASEELIRLANEVGGEENSSVLIVSFSEG